MTDAPLRIWLQEPVGLEHERTWCAEPMSDDDDEYHLHTRAALAASPLVQEIVAEAVRAEREACARVCETLGALGGVTPNPRAEWKTHADNLAAAIRARGETPSSSPVAASIAPETDAKPQGRWCWACLRHEVQADGWCRKCGGMTGQPQDRFAVYVERGFIAWLVPSCTRAKVRTMSGPVRIFRRALEDCHLSCSAAEALDAIQRQPTRMRSERVPR